MPARADDEGFSELVRSLLASQRQAEEMDLQFLAGLLDMAAIEAALQWDGGHEALKAIGERGDRLLRLKLRVSLANRGNIVALFPKGT